MANRLEPPPLDLAGDKDSDFPFFKPLFDAQVGDSWTIYDLRSLPKEFSKYGKVDPELERVIFGYDFVVLIPDAQPSHDLRLKKSGSGGPDAQVPERA